MTRPTQLLMAVVGIVAVQRCSADKIQLKPYLTDIPTTQADFDFLNYISTYGKSYTSFTEFKFRREIYKRNTNLRAQKQPAKSNYILADNFFSDQAPGEMGERFKYNYVAQVSADLLVDDATDSVNAGPYPDQLDWRAMHAITEPRNQGYCGANWAYAAVSAIETAHFLMEDPNTRTTVTPMSVQQMIDCIDNNQNGCGTAHSVQDVLAFTKTNKVMTEASYTTTGLNQACKQTQGQGEFNTEGVVVVNPLNDPVTLMHKLKENPVIAIINPGPEFIFYQSGILDSTTCSSDYKHPIHVVGYGVENGIKYFIGKNSYGPQWGENGYIRIAMQDGAGVCGIQQFTLYPTSL